MRHTSTPPDASSTIDARDPGLGFVFCRGRAVMLANSSDVPFFGDDAAMRDAPLLDAREKSVGTTAGSVHVAKSDLKVVGSAPSGTFAGARTHASVSLAKPLGEMTLQGRRAYPPTLATLVCFGRPAFSTYDRPSRIPAERSARLAPLPVHT